MDFYEELGLDRSATPEDIHRAYRNLTRLLHPDPQQDGELRRLAELQMRRVNEIFAVLNDPISRKRYDSEFTGPAWVPFIPDETPARAVWAQRVRGGAWVIAAGLGVVGITWYLTREGRRATLESPAPRIEVLAPAPAALPAKSNQRGVRLQQQNKPSERVRSTVQAGVKRSSPEAPPVLPSLAPDAVSVLTPSLGISIASVPKFEGTWFYVAPAQRPDPSLYPPEFIEAVIHERDGWIEGRYRARYTVRDRAISPNVAFTFEGAARDKAADLRWTGSGDAHGEVRLRLLSASRLEINWTAVELGTKMGLAAGTAVLVRRLENE